MFTQGSWLNPPENWSADGAQLRVTTDASTDFWRKTQYGFIRDSGHFFGTQIDGDFTAQLHVAAQYSALYDQAGLMVRIDEQNWIKCGVEFSDGQLLLSSVLTLDKSDWAVSIAPAMPDGFWLRVTVEKGAIRVQYSTDGLRSPGAVSRRRALPGGPHVLHTGTWWPGSGFFAVFHRSGAAKRLA